MSATTSAVPGPGVPRLRAPASGLVLAALFQGALLQPIAAQESARGTLTAGQAARFAAAATLVVGTLVFAPDPPVATCAPCDPRTLPGIDRWALASPDATLARLSDVGLVALAAGTLGDTWHLDRRAALVSLEAAVWTHGLTQLGKMFFQRKRPVMYGAGAPAAATDADSFASLPSGHAALAAALAASYWLNTPRNHAEAAKWFAAGTTVAVAALRVAAGKHFPSDVAAGAALGTLTAIVVRELR